MYININFHMEFSLLKGSAGLQKNLAYFLGQFSLKRFRAKIWLET